jgi:hypothetical protein
VAKATYGDERSIRDKGLDGLCQRGTLVDEGPCLVVSDPGSILIWIVPAEWFASALCYDIQLTLHSCLLIAYLVVPNLVDGALLQRDRHLANA